jgi:flavin reductase (DIM6/NTAB) family NADH-FMN oxidoreductase RutF
MTSTSVAPDIDGAMFRKTMGHVPTSVAVVTATDGGEAVGMTVGTLTSISLDPPLVGFFADSTSVTAARIRDIGTFCVNVLGEGQHDDCRAFSSSRGDRFAGRQVIGSAGGAIRLAGALAWIECEVDSSGVVGDHEIVVGRVRALEVAARPSRPMVFYRGALCRLDGRTVPTRGAWQLDHYDEW